MYTAKCLLRASLAAVIAGCALNVASAQSDEEVILACARQDWERSIAVFVDAPASLITMMHRAFEEARVSNAQACEAQPDSLGWLCDSNALRYYRGIKGSGETSNSGYVCTEEADGVLPHLRYYPKDYFDGGHCAELSWDDETSHYEVILNKDT